MSVTAISILNSSALQKIVTDYKEVQKQKELNAWNIFNLSSSNNQLENFHSDIIASLLDPQGVHGEGDRFLMAFVDFLNDKHGLSLAKADYIQAWVPREKGRIDVGVFGHASRRCIIIENKMNNASDQYKQLERYIDFAMQHHYVVDAVVYLSLDGYKYAPIVPIGQEVVRNVAAFNNRPDMAIDLVSGWLYVCKNGRSGERSRSFIHQYTTLIMDLTNKALENTTKDEFYKFVSRNSAQEAIKVIMQLHYSMPEHRTNLFLAAVPTDTPFALRARWKPNFMVLEGYVEDGNSYKLHIAFDEDGKASVSFWIPLKDNEGGFKILTRKLERIGMIDEFERSNNGYVKVFGVSEKYRTLEDVDGAIAEFVNKLKDKLSIKS